MQTYNQQLLDILAERRAILDRDSEDKKVDTLAEEVLNFIAKNRDNLLFEEIIEALTHLGHAPSLLYDDNGHFAVSADGFQNFVETEDFDKQTVFENTAIIPPHGWKKSVREALYFHLDQE